MQEILYQFFTLTYFPFFFPNFPFLSLIVCPSHFYNSLLTFLSSLIRSFSNFCLSLSYFSCRHFFYCLQSSHVERFIPLVFIFFLLLLLYDLYFHYLSTLLHMFIMVTLLLLLLMGLYPDIVASLLLS